MAEQTMQTPRVVQVHVDAVAQLVEQLRTELATVNTLLKRAVDTPRRASLMARRIRLLREIAELEG